MALDTRVAQSLEKTLIQKKYRIQHRDGKLGSSLFAYTVLEKLLPNDRVVRVVIRPRIVDVIIEGDPESEDYARISENKFEDINVDARLHDHIIAYILLMEEIYSVTTTLEEN